VGNATAPHSQVLLLDAVAVSVDRQDREEKLKTCDGGSLKDGDDAHRAARVSDESFFLF
jgi:hypothetical protein